MPDFQDHQRHIATIIRKVQQAISPTTLLSHLPDADHTDSTPAGVIAVGKAAPSMYEGYAKRFAQPATRFMLVPEGVAAPHWAHLGDHPFPTQRNLDATQALIEFIEQLKKKTPTHAPIVVLLSGGASALLTRPRDSIPLNHYSELTKSLMRVGADIHQLNCVRKHAEQLKGGRLAALLAPCPIEAFILSDVIGDDLSVIGSGPISPDPTTFADALDVLDTFAQTQGQTYDFIKAGTRGEHPETPKHADPLFNNVTSHIIANNATATTATAESARNLGFNIAEIRTNIIGEAIHVANQLAAKFQALPTDTPTAIVLGGETTVTVGDATGTGGPSTELALATALAIENNSDTPVNFAIATFATDGIDGPTDAAGAIATNQTLAHARAQSLNPAQALANHDSYNFFNQLDALIKTGPTGTNVNDIALMLRY